ncbi:predicted protein [Algibacter lectus]|uniref:Fibronectin type-III domain-containing protein n=1 Tax=Algibacter lectus TaxID=221126 RepID=A0A090X096_9FLAO|nr:hypothetical protein [Algibacter lectus]GAL81114.1 predicted protein [Algibacter lectus]
MKNSLKYIFGSFVLCLFIFNCGGNSDDDVDPDPVNEVKTPTAATLSFPEENSECTEGSSLTSTESTILFNWNDAQNVTSYQLFIKNLDTQTTTNYTSSVSEKSVTILRGTPYSWYVVSKNSGTETAQSNTWKFYNAGEATSSYAPFPAEMVSPALSASLAASTVNLSLEWLGEDVDNDITEYEVLFGTVSPPTQTESTTTANNVSVTVSSGNTYFWRVITKDANNNTSESQVFEFTVQ